MFVLEVVSDSCKLCTNVICLYRRFDVNGDGGWKEGSYGTSIYLMLIMMENMSSVLHCN